jgi:tetratricopeptide (TPR) repeat protein
MGRYEEAVESLKQAVRLDPKFSDAFYNLAVAFAHLKKRSDALASLEAAIRINPNLASEALQDKDFESLRSEPRFQALVTENPSPTAN